MKITLTKPTADVWDHHLLIDLEKSCTCLSSAIVGGGFSGVRYIVNRSVPKGWNCQHPVSDMESYLEALGHEPQNCIGLLTGVSVTGTQRVKQSKDDWSVEAFVTAGTSNAAAAGGRFALEAVGAGTINIIILISGQLSSAALVNAVQTATEAKSAALAKSNITTRFGEIATGTTTDTITVVNLKDEPTSAYAGLATIPGYLIAQTVYKAISNALEET